MALASSTLVRLPKPATVSFADTMNEHRTWLDNHNIQPASFRPVFVDGVIGFEIGFGSEREATLFDKQFG